MKNNQVSILIVDDHPAVRNTMIDVLNEEGFNTDHADNGETGLKKCLENSYDFVLIDVQMPKRNGVEVLRNLKKQRETIPEFIFVTAYSLPELKQDAVQLGCLAFLQKPIRIEKIISLIKDYKSVPVLVCLKNEKQAESTVNKLEDKGFYTIKAPSVDDALIQLRQINYKFLIYDSDWPGTEQESIHTTIKSLKSNTFPIETNEDEDVDFALNKINNFANQYEI